MKLDIRVFKGMMPKLSSRLLPPENAEFAEDCYLDTGDLRPVAGKTLIPGVSLRGGNVKSIFKYGIRWFSWTADVHAMRSPLAKDPYDRVYFTGAPGQPPQVTSNQIATGAPPYPSASFGLGIPAPIDPIAATAVFGADDGDSKNDESRVYVYTYVSAYDEEGPPSPPSNMIELTNPSVDSASLLIPIPVSNTFNINRKRIYRSATSATDTNYYFVADVLLSSTTYSDTRLTEQLGSAISTEDYLPPPAGMRGLVLGANGIAAGFDRNEFLCCEPYLPYAWPQEYRRSLEYDIQAIAPTSTGFVVGTQAMPYLIQGVHPRAMSDRKIPLAQACIGPSSMVDMGGFVLYASPDGLVSVTEGGAASVVTRELLTKTQWQANYMPEVIRGARYDDLYIGFIDDGLGRGFAFDPRNGNLWDIHDFASASFNDLLNDQLYLAINSKLYTWDTNIGTPRPYTWRSKMFHTQDVSFSVLKVWTSTPAMVGIVLWADDLEVLRLDALPSETFKIPPARGTRWQIELSGTAIVQGVTLAQSMDELG